MLLANISGRSKFQLSWQQICEGILLRKGLVTCLAADVGRQNERTC